MDFKNRVALVTGGSRGIGRAICIRLAKGGADIIINYAGNEAAAQETAAACQKYGVRTLCVQADISREEEADQLFDKALENFKTIDILVNNAGITDDDLLLKMKAESFDSVIKTNLYGTFYCMKRASRVMLRHRYGRIISLSSVVGLRGNAGQANYAASKAGVLGMTRSLAKELAAKNITVNAVAPGMVATDMTAKLGEKTAQQIVTSIPAGRAGTPEEVAEAVAYFASESAGYVTGQVLCVDGGMAV